MEIKAGWSGYVEREGFGKGWGIWERPDWLNASLALPAALGRVLRAAREREQPHLRGGLWQLCKKHRAWSPRALSGLEPAKFTMRP